MTALQEQPTIAEPERMTRKQGLTLVILLATQFMLAADFSILNVAIPEIGESLAFSLANLQWIATAFAVAASGFTLIFGRVADLLGRRKLFIAGMAVLVLASLLGGLAQNPTQLLVARVGQGLATAITTPAALALLTTSFPEGRLRNRALGLNGALLSAGFTAGAIMGGLLTGLLSWRWAFLINVAVGLVVLAFAPLLLKESKAEQRTRLDLPGSITISAGLVALVFGISRTGEHGWGDGIVLASLGASAVLLTSFWLIEQRVKAPLISVSMLTRRTISWSNFGGLITFTMMTSVVFLMTLYLQQVLDYSPVVTGLAFTGLGTAAFIGGMYAARIIGKITSRVALIAGLLLQAAATAALLAIGDASSGLAIVLAATTVAGLGHVMAIVSFMVTATSGVPDDEQGLATGLTSMTQQVGITIGIPILSTLATSRIQALEGSRPMSEAVLGGVRLALAVDAAVVLVASLLIALFLRKRHVNA